MWRSLVTTDKVDAEAKFKEYQRSKKGKNLKLSEFMSEVDPFIRVDTVSDTADFYAYITNKVCQIIGDKKLTSYTIMDFERYKLQRYSDIKKVTVNKELRTIRALFQRTVKFLIPT